MTTVKKPQADSEFAISRITNSHYVKASGFRTLLLLVTVGLVLLAFAAGWASNLHSLNENQLQQYARVGDSFGMISSILGGFSLFFVAYTLTLQREELSILRIQNQQESKARRDEELAAYKQTEPEFIVRKKFPITPSSTDNIVEIEIENLSFPVSQIVVPEQHECGLRIKKFWQKEECALGDSFLISVSVPDRQPVSRDPNFLPDFKIEILYSKAPPLRHRQTLYFCDFGQRIKEVEYHKPPTPTYKLKDS